jgi:hypothetical protein
MRRTKLVLAAAAVMVALLVAFAVPAMARDRNNDRNDDHHNSFNVFRDFDRFDRDDFFFDRFDPFDNGFGDFEQEADSGDIVQTFDVSGTGDNSNQCVGISGNANTGNAQNQVGVTDFGNFNGFDRFDRDNFFFDRNGGDFDFDDSEATLDVGGFSSTSCDQAVNQAAAAG